MVFAPASMVSSICSSVWPPVAIIGNSSPTIFLVYFTSSAVFLPPAIFKTLAPALTFPNISSYLLITVAITAMSSVFEISSIFSFYIGAFTTTPAAPSNSACKPIFTDLSPDVVPPPIPTNTGTDATSIMADIIFSCGVKG